MLENKKKYIRKYFLVLQILKTRFFFCLLEPIVKLQETKYEQM